MSKTRMTYFEADDILHFAISDEEEANSVEISPNITAELNQTFNSPYPNLLERGASGQ